MTSFAPSRFFQMLVALFAFTTFSLLLLAQSSTEGAVAGTVTDPQGAVVPNAKATARNMGTNKESTATTDNGGQFRIARLQPGIYSVAVQAPGFTPYTRENVVVEVGLATPLEIKLAVGGKAETVEVTSEAPVLQTTQSDFTTNVNQVSINNLPLLSRRWVGFALGTPGATPDAGFGLISFRGISGLLNNNSIDGADNNQAFFSEERGRTRINYTYGLASVQEFQVNGSNFSAEYGRAAGGVINAVTKSGSNTLHGVAFYYNRDANYGAINPFATQSILVAGTPTTIHLKPTDKRHQFGGTLGGALIKDRLFFFFSYDQQKRNFPGVAAPGSPTFFTLTSANQTTLTAGDSTHVGGVTNAQRDAGLAFLQSLTGPVLRRGDQMVTFPKLDWRISNNNTLALSYNRMRWDSPAGIQTGAVVGRGNRSFGDDFVKLDSFVARLSSAISSRISNEARFQYGRDFEFQNSQTPAPGEPTTGPHGLPPQITISSGGGFIFGKANFLERRAFPDERRTQVFDSASFAFGKHLFKIGVDYNHVHDLENNLFQEEGAYSYSNLTDWLSDFAKAGLGCKSGARTVSCYSSYNQGFGPTAFKFTTNDYNFFVQDDWRALPRLTLNLGLRYEYEQLPDPQIPNPLLPQSSKFPSDKNNIGPRVGFAWNVWGDGKSVFRGGYGIYYGRIINSAIANAITNTGLSTGQIQVFFSSPSAAGAPVYPATFASATGAATKPDVVVFSPSFGAPLIHQADLVFEHEFAQNTSLSLSYLISLGRQLPIDIDRNLNAPTTTATYTVIGGPLAGQKFTFPVFTGARPNTNFGRITNIESLVDSRYDALVAQVNRRLTKGLQFQASYTWSHALDLNQLSTTFTNGNDPLNPFNPDADYSSSNFDLRHKFGFNIVWMPQPFKDNRLLHAVLGDWTFSPIVTLISGRPFTATTSGSLAGSTAGGIIGAGGSIRFPGFGRNAFRTDGNQNLDLRLSRRLRVRERASLELFAEAFNLTNTFNVAAVSTRMFSVAGTAAAPTLTFDPVFSVPTSASTTLSGPRQIQIGARFEF